MSYGFDLCDIDNATACVLYATSPIIHSMSIEADKNIQRYSYNRHDREETNRFCLLSVMGYESDDPLLVEKRDQLLRSLQDEWKYDGQTRQVLECTMGNCDVTVTEDIVQGIRTRDGKCLAADYCIKQAFEAVKGEDSVEAGRARYRKLMDTCESHADKYSAGNFCPKIDCGLSAGVSIDMVPGTSGECIVEIRSPQGQLFDSVD